MTKRGTRKLSDVARKVVAPSGVVSTGWPAVEETCRKKLGIEFDDWQSAAGRLILAKRADGKLASMIGGVGISIPRQVGKTYLIAGMVFGLSVNKPGLLTIWSAHHGKTHAETFLAMQVFAQRQRVAPHIKQVFTGSGDEEIRFRNGSRILFGAREHGFGRGIPGVDIIVDDEAQIMSEKALDAQLATVNTSKFGLVIYLGTPPRPEDNSEAFTRMRSEAWDGTLQDAAWIEIGAPPDADPSDRKVWPVMNPSYPHRTPAESILRLQRKLTPESFFREGMGIWDGSNTEEVIDPVSWGLVADEMSVAVDRFALAVDVTPDRSMSSVALAGQRADGLWHVELDEQRPGVGWLIPYLTRLLEANPQVRSLVIDNLSPAASLLEELSQAKVRVTATDGRIMAAACGSFYDGVMEGWLRHTNQPQVNFALSAARKRSMFGGESWGWSRKNAVSDITPIVACTLALWGAQVAKVKAPARKGRSSSERRAVVL